MTKKHKIVIAITGASGSIYAKVLLDKLSKLSNQIEQVGVIMSAAQAAPVGRPFRAQS